MPWEPAALFPFPQRHPGDCAIAALASILAKPYADVSCTARRLAPKSLKQGLWTREIVAIAAAHGVRLRRRRRVDLSEDSGILTVEADRGRWQWSHAVVLFRGVIYDPGTQLLWEPDAYLHDAGVRILSLLVPEDVPRRPRRRRRRPKAS